MNARAAGKKKKRAIIKKFIKMIDLFFEFHLNKLIEKKKENRKKILINFNFYLS
jgi:hypothetical protein